jgi:hypothetical protein
MDRVGVEPTTSATLFETAFYLLSKGVAKERELYCSNPIRSTLKYSRLYYVW